MNPSVHIFIQLLIYSSSYLNLGESRSAQDLVYVDPSTGALKSSKPVGAPLKEREGPGVRPGKVMAIVEGRHRGLKCEVQNLEPKEPGRSERAKVRLLPSYEIVVLRCTDLDEVRSGSRSESGKESSQRRKEAGKEERTERRPGSDRETDKERDRERDSKRKRGDYDEPIQRKTETAERPWLVPNIR